MSSLVRVIFGLDTLRWVEVVRGRRKSGGKV